jgi:hypothetical protein
MTFLVGLALAYGYTQATVAKLQVSDVKRHKFGTAEGAGEAKQQDGAIALSFDIGFGLVHHCNDSICGGGRFAGRCAPSAS